MSARIFLHPSCAHGTPRHELFRDGLTTLGYDIDRLAVVDRGLGLMNELVRKVEQTGARMQLRRFDGTQYTLEVDEVKTEPSMTP